MSAHTPGPWSADGCTVIANGKSIATTDISHVAGGAREPNARLIAAAPDLLKALKALTDYDVDQTFCLTAVPCGECQECAARGAISKAEGRS